MTTAKQDEPNSWNESNPPQAWTYEPDAADTEPAWPGSDEEESPHMLEEPGYGHGV